jgi:transglutaminase-like putative cysteine protease
VNGAMTLGAPTGDPTTQATEAFALRQGAAQDFAHVFIAGARWLGSPARYVSGYIVDDERPNGAQHAWAEAHTPKLGWIGFDATIGECVAEGHARVAIGFDALSAAPYRASRAPGGEVSAPARR